jgi:L-threonylcarbamoyladenylate synthase
MDIYSKEDLVENFDLIASRIEKGEIFIYPTDTVYGIGCDSRNFESVEKLRQIRDRSESAFSVLVPSKDWIGWNCIVLDSFSKEISKLPGAFTFILQKKDSCDVASNVSFSSKIGVRMIDHWFQGIVERLGFAIITTSVNKKGDLPMTCLEDLDEEIKRGVDFMIDDGKIDSKSSKVVDLVDSKVLRN